jgi:protein SCO1/2
MSVKNRWSRLMLAVWVIALSAVVAGQSRWHEGYFPNVPLITQNGERVHFYDLIKGRTVAIELIYTSCQFACPLETARLAQVQKLLGDRMGKDIFFYSISIDPAHDTPAVMKAFAGKFGAGPGWTFLTGRAEDIELLSRKLGLYSKPDPENKDGHTPALLFGNEATGQWIRGSAVDNPKMMATMLGEWVAGYPATAPSRTYADAKPLPKFDNGKYLFSSKCAACHGLGDGRKIGPDLAGITRTRDRDWLARYIAAPEEMVKSGDPIAKQLSTSYKQVRMPNLLLTPAQIHDVIGYLDTIAGSAQK